MPLALVDSLILQKLMLGTSLLGGVAGVVGSFAVLRRRALVGDMLAHAALPGLCIAFLIVGSRSTPALLLGAFVSGLLGIGAITLATRWTRTKEDAAIGIVLGTFFGAGMVLLSIIQRLPVSGKAGLKDYLFGSASGILNSDIIMIAVVSIVCLVLTALFYKEFKTFSFDPEFACSQGWPGFFLELTMMGMLALITIVGLPAVGVVLMAAMIIIPGAAARFWTNQLGLLLLVSGIVGAGMGIGGTLVVERIDLPPGPVIVLCGTAIFLVSMFFAPERGIVAQLARDWTLKRKVARENVLRTLYELSEGKLPTTPVVSISQLLAARGWTQFELTLVLRRLRREGLLEIVDGGARLTARGLEQAIAVTRAHRLWELYLIDGANIAPDHVDRDADVLEHVLPGDLVERLESRLAEEGRVPIHLGEVPASPHELPHSDKVQEQPHA